MVRQTCRHVYLATSLAENRDTPTRHPPPAKYQPLPAKPAAQGSERRVTMGTFTVVQQRGCIGHNQTAEQEDC